jgi:hypothetical protein
LALFKRSYASISNVIVFVAMVSQYTITHESQCCDYRGLRIYPKIR